MELFGDSYGFILNLYMNICSYIVITKINI